MIWQAGGTPVPDRRHERHDRPRGRGHAEVDRRAGTSSSRASCSATIPGWTDEWYQGLGDGTIATLATGAWMPGVLESSRARRRGQVARRADADVRRAAGDRRERRQRASPCSKQSKNPALAAAFVALAQPRRRRRSSRSWTSGGFPATIGRPRGPGVPRQGVRVLRRPEDQRGAHRRRRTTSSTGWQYLPYQVYANSIFSDTVGKSYPTNADLNDGPEGLAGRARRVRQRAGLHGQRVATTTTAAAAVAARRRLPRGPLSVDTDENGRMPDVRHRRRPTSCSTASRSAILSGALHYFRVHPDQWARPDPQGPADGPQHHRDLRAVERARAPRAASSTPTGGLDLGRFLDLVAAEGMHAIVRPGPYICAEWDNGGLPAWLFRRAASRRPPLRAALPRRGRASTSTQRATRSCAPRQVDHGGPVLLVQVENEYGAYGADKAYLRRARRADPRRRHHRAADHRRPARSTQMLAARRPRRACTAPARSARAALERLATLREPPADRAADVHGVLGRLVRPLGRRTTTRRPSRQAAARARRAARRRRLGQRLHVPRRHELRPHQRRQRQGHATGRSSTSYDYDAPLDEAGHPTAKYCAFREVIAPLRAGARRGARRRGPRARARRSPLERAVAARRRRRLGRAGAATSRVPTLDELGHDRGFARVPHRASTAAAAGVLDGRRGARPGRRCSLDGAPVGILDARAPRARDRAARRRRGELASSSSRTRAGSTTAPASASTRASSAASRLDGVPLTGLGACCADRPRPRAGARCGAAAARATAPAPRVGPTSFARGTFELDAPADLFLDTLRLGQGHRLGQRLLPRTLLAPRARSARSSCRRPSPGPGANEVVVLEFEAIAEPVIRTARGARARAHRDLSAGAIDCAGTTAVR